ncbi:U-box domain-containing protein 43-like [Tasmannia lanceolata]|uniref:U-box domain-containing protein 43-like n=1 Tax=Tasmannia lanceolata TaxID=3420 RepID=UPI0040649428
MASLVGLIPIGTVLTLLTKQVLETALAAKDVLIEKESFKILSKYLYDIEPVLKELQLHELNDSRAARQALESLEKDVKKAKALVEKYKNRARFYLLVKCRSIVGEIQDVTRDIGRSLESLSIASTEILSDISEKLNRLHDEMQRAEFEASQSQVRIVEKLNQGLREQKSDLGFANDMLEDIARAVGVPIEPSEISKELENFRKEKEEAAIRKEQAEVLFLEQVIKLLSRADAANDQEEIKAQYLRRVQTIEKFETQDEYILPLKAFMCPIERTTVMVDPVSLCTGTTCERASIQAWFESGHRTDPDTGLVLDDLTLRPNVSLRQTIEEWRELNYCLQIRSSRGKLLSGIDSASEEALSQIQGLIKENSINKDWIAFGGIIDIIVPLLGTAHNKEVKRRMLITLRTIVVEHSRNKDRVVDSGGVDQVVRCLVRDPNISKAAVELLFELLQDSSGWNLSVCRKLSQQNNAILFLVTLLNGTIVESAEKAEAILLKLCDDDDDNISCAAAATWYRPLINRLSQGSESSRISMAKVLVTIELVDQNIKLLGEEGAIPPLVEMVSGNLKSKDCAFTALVKLSSCHENKKLIAQAGAVPLVLGQMFSSHVPIIIRARCSEILENLSSDDGIEFLVDADGSHLELEPIVNNLLAIQQHPTSYLGIRKPALRALLGIYKSRQVYGENVVAGANGVAVILPLIEDPDQEIREVVIKLLFCFSQHESEGITDFLLVERRLEGFLSFLEDNSRDDVKMAAAGLLANLPKSELTFTKNLIDLDVLPSLFNILRSGTAEAKENALSALLRFTDPANIEMQRMVVELRAYPLLLSFLKSGSVTAKARAAALIGYLSLNTPKLTAASKATGCWCFRRARVPVCEVHGGICGIITSFCLLKANALPELVKLLQECVHETAYEAIQALTTLVQENSPYRGAIVLHEANAICPMLEVLNWGTSSLKAEVLGVLEKVFAVKEMAEFYCSMARIPLVGLTTQSHEDEQLRMKAVKVMAQLERYSKSGPLV